METNQTPKEKQKPDNQNRKRPVETYARYSSIAFQMIFIILVGVFGGMLLDKWIKWEFPVFTFVLTILAVIFAMYYAIRDLLRTK